MVLESGVGTIHELLEVYPDVLDEMIELLEERQRAAKEDEWKREHGG